MNALKILTPADVHNIAPAVFGHTKHESRSDKYVFISTADIMNVMAEHGFFPTDARQAKSRKPGRQYASKHLIRFSRPGSVTDIGLGGLVPEIVIMNSHDGTGAYKIMAGVMRLVCLNGMLVGDGVIGHIAVHHSGKVLDDVIEGTYRIIDQTHRAIDNAREMKETNLTHYEQVAFAQAASELRWDKEKTTVNPIAMLSRNRIDDAGNDVWTVLNVLQEKVIRGGMPTFSITQRGRRVMKARELRSVTENTRINSALWDLAEEVMAIKREGEFVNAYRDGHLLSF